MSRSGPWTSYATSLQRQRPVARLGAWSMIAADRTPRRHRRPCAAWRLASGTAHAHSHRMNKAEVDRWLGSYVEAWRTYDRDLIGALFAEDISYRFHPYDAP